MILITNDDGYNSPGIAHLAGIASRFGEVVVVAPLAPQSGKSSALTVDAPLKLRSHAPIGEAAVYSVDGTPVDCVKLALHAVLDRRPDLVLSGINHGSNAAINNIYSGTMGAAMEGCVVGIPSVGFSILSHDPSADLSGTDDIIADIISKVLDRGLPEGVCLNVNFPAGRRPEGLKAVRAAAGYWTEEYKDYASPHGAPFYWLTGKFHNLEPDCPETDEYWLARGWATVVPIRPDQTATDAIGGIKTMLGC
ncbi:MAG: 5'/3'-nucleotidase SurE [Duncaniella sp.]|nr:5'/3'-nucleotidase SurE [Duncaniella sp.]